MLFAHLKRILKLDRLRLRGPYSAPAMNSTSPPSPKTFASWPKSSRTADNPRQLNEKHKPRA